MAEVLIKCVPDPSGLGSTQAPCPQGQVFATVEVQLPTVISLDDFGTYSAMSAGLIITLYVTGLGIGWVISMMRGR